MKVLVTCAGSEIARSIASAISKSHQVTLTDLPGPRPAKGVVANALDHDASTDALVAGHKALIHIGYMGRPDDATALLDYYGRRTYNLLLAASKAGVERCIFVSTLLLLKDYDENLTVTERWRTHAPADDPALLACHIGENVCKEFARDGLIKVATLRLGWPIVDGSRAKAARTGETAALAGDDLATVVNAALVADIDRWQDVHVQSPIPNSRFLMHAAGKLFSYPNAPAAPVSPAAVAPAPTGRKGGR